MSDKNFDPIRQFTPDVHQQGTYKKKNLTLTVLLSLGGPLVFLYLGGWRVFLTLDVCALVFQVLLMPVNLDFAMLPEKPRFLILFLTTLVYLHQALRYRHVYNWTIEQGQHVKNLRTFKRGWFVCVSVYHGLLLVYAGLLLLWADISRSGSVGVWSVLKAVLVTSFGLYILNLGLRWVNLRLKRKLLTEQELAEHLQYRYLYFFC